jgi:hypothetical protein
VIPQNNGGFGKVAETRDAYFETEIVPLMRRMLRVNDWSACRCWPSATTCAATAA